MNQVKAVVVSAILLGLLLVTPSWATPVSDWLAASEISSASSLPDGNHVYLRLEEIIKIKNDPAYIVIAEPFNRKDKLICLTNPSPELRLGQVVDVEGDLLTLPSGVRALHNVTVWGYASESGELTYHPSIIKCMPEVASWPWSKIDLSDRSIPTANTASTASISSDEPNTNPAEGPRFYPRIGNTVNSNTQTQGIRTQSFYPGIPDLTGLPAGSPVELQCKRIIAVGTETINSTLYKYLDIAEDLPSTDWIRCYYSAGTPTTSNRINKITGQIQYTNGGTTEVICVDDGPDYNPQTLVGTLSLVSPNTVAFVRTQANGASATLTGKVVTANQTDFPGALYVQEPSGSGNFGGIRVLYSGAILTRGSLIDVAGTVALGADGEREINAGSTGVTFVEQSVVPGALGMPNKHLGGGDFNVNTPGVNYPTGSGTGLYNKGLLVKAWGKVTAVDATNKFFYIDDGTGFQDGSGNTGVKVNWAWSSAGKPSILPPAVNWYVSVTGLSSSEIVNSTNIIRVLRPRDQDDITIHKGGDPYTGNPAPGWAEDVVPTDSSPAGEYGPSSADSVDLATGAGENNPEPDVVIENPSGPRVEFSRRYRSTIAEAGYSSPGLSLGWVHNYDSRIHGTTGSWADLMLTYPNGATELLRPELSGGNPTGNFVALGAPYIVTGQPGGTMGQWDWIRITFPDETSWKFTAPNSGDPDSYLLLQMTDQLGHSILINRVSTTDARLLSITDDSSNTLMSLSYSGGYISTVSDVSVAGSSRDVTFAFVSEAGATVLKSVSQPNSTISLRWRYGYTGINGHPYLTWVEAPDCTGTTGMRGHAVNYNADGKVSSLVDSNGNQRAYVYNGDSTQVLVKDQVGKTVEAWTQKIGPKNQDLGVVDADNHATSKEYQADYRLWRATNKNNQQTQFSYDSYVNVRTATDPRGLVTTYNYDDVNHPFRLTSVQTGTKTSTTYEYDGRGLLWKINTPLPGRQGGTDRVTTTYTYTTLGNVSTATSPAPNWNSGAVITTAYDYTSDPDYGISGITEKLGQPLRVTVYEGDPINNQVLSRAHFRYDSRGRVEEVIDGTIVTDPNFRHRTNYVYNDNDQVTEIWYAPTGSDYTKRAHLIYTYSYPGGPLHSLDLYDENGSSFRHVDAANGNEGELLAEAGSILPLSSAYDAMYRVKQITDGRSYATRFNYNAVGNPTSIAYPNGPGTTWGFDADHNLNKRTDGLNRATNYTLDAVDSRVTDVSYPSGSPAHYDYDVYGRVTGMTDSTGSVTYTYDDNDLILTSTTTYTGLTAKTVTYTYYPDGSRETVRVSGLSGTPTSATIRNYYSYDATYQGRLVSTVVPWVGGGTATIKCFYDWNGQVIRQGTPYVNTNYGYNARGFRTQLLNQPVWTQGPESLFTNMQYDAAGNLTQYNYDMHIGYDYSQWQYGWSGTRLTGTLSYTYDDLNRLTREVRASSDPAYSYDVSFTPDAADNIESIRGLSLSYNSNNQVSGYTYDDNGNLTGCRGYTFGYDCRDLPTSVTGGMSNVTMQYRADGLRTQKTVGSTVRYYIYDGDKVLCELNNLGQLVRAYGYGPNGLVQSALYPATSVPFNIYTFDPLGSPVHTLYVSGANPYVSRITGYDAFGKRCWDDRVTFPGSGGSASDPMGIGFLAQYGAFTDYETRPADTETPLVLMGVRYYDPITGRFISRDPAADSMNDYAYCANNPVMGFDPSGMGDARWCTYWNDVGKVFKGEFNAVNPVNMYHGIRGLVSVCRKKGLKAGGSALLHGTIRSYTGLFQLDDMERCGESTMVWTLTLSPAIKKIPSPFRGRAGASVITATEAEATIAGKIAGYTKHGINQAISRDGTGVSPKAILDAVKNPVKVIEQSGGRTKYVGSSAEVVLNAKGKVITVIAKTRAAHRIR